jgi:Leucine-rich repeat (LRR) protein
MQNNPLQDTSMLNIPFVDTWGESESMSSSTSPLISQNVSNAKIVKHTMLKPIPSEDRIDELISECLNDKKNTSLNIKNAKILNIPNLLLTQIPNLDHIVSIGFQSNDIEEINPVLFEMINLTSLDFTNNKLLNIPKQIAKLTKLKRLELGSNNLVDLPCEFDKLTNLEILNLEKNCFRNIPYVITKMSNLKKLYLVDNPDIISFPSQNYYLDIPKLSISIDNHPLLIQDWENVKSDLIQTEIDWGCNYPDHVIDKLYIGGIRTVMSEHVYTYLNINVVFTTASEPACKSPLIIPNMIHLYFPINDSDEQRIDMEIIDCLHGYLKNNNGCIVHCFKGASRSATVVIAYLMKYHNMELDDAYYYLKNKRSTIRPNNGFWKQLIQFNKILFPTSTKDFTNIRE